MKKQQIDAMVNRFLGWKLPDDFAPDAGIDFTPPEKLYPTMTNPRQHWPTGTNLLDADQAQAMVEYLVNGVGENAETERVKALLRALADLMDTGDGIREAANYDVAWERVEEAFDALAEMIGYVRA